MTPLPSPQNPNPQSSFQNQVTPVQIPAPKVSWRLKKLPFLILDAAIVFGIIALCIFAFGQWSDNNDLRKERANLQKNNNVLAEDLMTATNALEEANVSIVGLSEDIKDKDKEIALQGQEIIKQQRDLDKNQTEIVKLQDKVKLLAGDLKVARAKIVKMQGELMGHTNSLRVAQGQIQDLEQLLDARAKIDEAVNVFLKGQIAAHKADKEKLENAIEARKAGEKKSADGIGHLKQLEKEALTPRDKKHWGDDVENAKIQLATNEKTNDDKNQKDNEKIEALVVKIATADKRLKDWDESVTKHATAIEAQKEKIANLEELKVKHLAALEKRNGELKALEAVLANKVKELKEQCEQQLANLEEQLQGVIAGKDKRIAKYEQSFKGSVIALDIIGKTYKGSLTEEIAQLVKGIYAKVVEKETLQRRLEGLGEKLNFAKKLQASFEELSKAAPELEPLQQKLLQTKEEIADLDRQIKAIETTEDGETQASGTLPVLIAKIEEMNERLAIAKMDLKDFTDKQKEVHAQAIRDAKDIEDKHTALQAKLGTSQAELGTSQAELRASEEARKDEQAKLDEQNAMLNKVRAGWEKNPGTVEGLNAVFVFLGELFDKDLAEAARGAKEAQTNLEKTAEELKQADMALTKSNHDIQNLVEDIDKLLNEPKEEGSDFPEKDKQLLAKFIDYFEKIKVQDSSATRVGKLKDDKRKGSELGHTANEREKKLKEGIAHKQDQIAELKILVNGGKDRIAEMEKLKEEIDTLKDTHKGEMRAVNKKLYRQEGVEKSELVRFANRYVGEVFRSKEEKFKNDLTEELVELNNKLKKLKPVIDKSQAEIDILKIEIDDSKKQQEAQKGNDPECDPTTKKDGSSAEKGKTLAEMEKDLPEKKKSRDEKQERLDQLEIEIFAITGVLGALKEAQNPTTDKDPLKSTR